MYERALNMTLTSALLRPAACLCFPLKALHYNKLNDSFFQRPRLQAVFRPTKQTAFKTLNVVLILDASFIFNGCT